MDFETMDVFEFAMITISLASVLLLAVDLTAIYVNIFRVL